MKILVFTLVFLVSFAVTRIPVAMIGRRIRRAPGSWNRYVSPLLVPLHLLMMSTVIHVALSWTKWASQVSTVTVYVTFAWLVFRAVTTLVFEWWFQDVQGVNLPNVLRRVIGVALGFVAGLAFVNVAFDVRLVDLAIVCGLGAVVMGLFFQGVMRDALLGVSLLLERRVVVGDYVRLERHEGEVIAVDWKSTTLLTTDDEQVVLPNRLVADSAIVRSRHEKHHHRVRIEVEVPGDSPPNTVGEVLVDAASTTRSVLREPPPVSRFVRGGDGKQLFEVLFWVEDTATYAQAASEARSVLWYRLRRAGLVPQAELSTPDETRKALLGVPLFATVRPDDLERLARSVSVQRFGKGEVLFHQGDAGGALYVVLSGALDILHTQAGATVHVASVREGNFVGEGALMKGEARSATAVASVDTVAIVIDKPTMLDVLKGDAELAGRIAKVMAERADDEAARERARDAGKDVASSSLLAKIREIFSL